MVDRTSLHDWNRMTIVDEEEGRSVRHDVAPSNLCFGAGPADFAEWSV
jgi:hypothetical protein